MGPFAVTAVQTLHVDLLFLGVHGMDPHSGFTTPNVNEANVDRALVDSARAFRSAPPEVARLPMRSVGTGGSLIPRSGGHPVGQRCAHAGLAGSPRRTPQCGTQRCMRAHHDELSRAGYAPRTCHRWMVDKPADRSEDAVVHVDGRPQGQRSMIHSSCVVRFFSASGSAMPLRASSLRHNLAALPQRSEACRPMARPKDENRLSDYVAQHLRRDLASAGVVVNREVEIRRTAGSGIGERTDIRVDAIAQGEAEVRDVLSLITETKGCWNRDLTPGLKAQLVEQYMKHVGKTQGIYLLVWFNADDWDKTDSRRQAVRVTTPRK